jgi:hypothetical protein
MTSIREIFSTFAPEYLQRYGIAMPANHRKVIDAITACRTEACGVAFYRCDSCAEPQQFFRSCGNRHCPTCQYNKTQQWLQKQLQRQLPGHHFLITFTVPEQLRLFIRQHQRLCYAALFKASSDAIKNSPQILNTSVATFPASSVSSIPGDELFSTIPTSTTSFAVGRFLHLMARGILPDSISFCPSKPSRLSSEPNSAIS